jgi:adenylate cyclase
MAPTAGHLAAPTSARRRVSAKHASALAQPPPLLPQPLGAEEHARLRSALAGPARLRARAGDLLSRFLLAEVVNGVLGAASLDALLERLVALASATLDAERGTVFLLDAESDELFARVALGGETAEIRIPRTTGIAGAVFASGRPEIVDDAYADPRFNPSVDRHTGYHTRSLVCTALVRDEGGIIGTFEVLNKRSGRFDRVDLALLQAIGAQAATALDQARLMEAQQQERSRDMRLQELTRTFATELEFDRLLEAIVDTAPLILDAERATLFIYDPAAGELTSRITAGGQVETIRIPSTVGLAGASFTARQPLNVARASADPRFYPGVDQHSGFHTHDVLCMPIIDKDGTADGVLQVLNKRHGRFTEADEQRLQVFAERAAIALRHAQLFADVVSLKSYTDSILRSMSDGVVTLDGRMRIAKVNDAARGILRLAKEEWLEGPALDLWGADNPWLGEALDYVSQTGGTDHRPDVEFVLDGKSVAQVNATVAPLRDGDGAVSGYTLILQDISRQKKAHATMTRYMARQFAERVMASDDDAAARGTYTATTLFSDIRRFTALAEKLTAQATVELLNEYFGEMAEIVLQSGGAVDKYIGDGLMAVFGAPAASAVDADSAARAATRMVERLRQLNRQRLERGAQALEIGVGIASGEIVAGPVGSAARTDFTVIGDSVNLAARIETATVQYGTTIMLAGETVGRLVSPARLRPIDLVRLKGKGNPTEIFELLDHHTPESFPRLDEALPLFEEGIKLYRARDWTRALDRFAQVLKIAPKDGPSWVYTDRCLVYRNHPPPDYWDGVWTMVRK